MQEKRLRSSKIEKRKQAERLLPFFSYLLWEFRKGCSQAVPFPDETPEQLLRRLQYHR